MLMEVIITTVLSTFLLLTLFASSSMMLNASHEYRRNVKLVNDARVAIDKIVWGTRAAGVANRRGIAEAVTSTVVINPTQIDYQDKDGVSHTYRLNNGNIEYKRANGAYETIYDANGALANNAAVNKTDLKFTQDVANVNYVTIDLILGEQISGRWYYASLSTKVAFRNS